MTNNNHSKESKSMAHLLKIAPGAWTWGNDGTFGKPADSPELNVIRFRETEMK